MPTAVILWIWICAYLNCAGWALSALHQMNAAGYATTLGLGAVALFAWGKKYLPPHSPAVQRGKYARRFQKLLPMVFFVLAAMVFIGGALYAPNNYDALTYRIPRVLHWLDKGEWHWIDSPTPRMNTRAIGFEWLMAPLLVLTRTTRFIFLLNFISFLFLPGLLFQMFRLLGVRRRVAWNWMWVVPTGYLYVLQAGSAANDSFATVFFLASLNFALRARKSQCFGDVAMSIICIALTTGAKQSNLPLGLPWIVAIWPALALIRRNKLRTISVVAVAAMTSYMPLAFMNHSHGSGWLGVESTTSTVLPMPVNAVGNSILLAVQNFAPPVQPSPKKVEAWIKSKIPARLLNSLVSGFESDFTFAVGELQMEESASIGLGVSLLAFVTLGYCAKRRAFGTGGAATRHPGVPGTTHLIIIAGLVALLLVMGKSQMCTLGRVCAAYYPLLFVPILLLTAADRLVRRKSWTAIAIASACSSALVLVLTPARPLWPAQTFFSAVAKSHGENATVQRAQKVYQCYAQRPYCLAPIRQLLPANTRSIGFISTEDDPETCLWFPFGKLRVRDVTAATDIQSRDFDYVVVDPGAFTYPWKTTFQEWLTATNGAIVGSAHLFIKVQKGVEVWSLVRLPSKK